MVNNRLTTFNIGGIHPDENKLSKGKPIENLPLPKEVKILTGQHTGASAVPIVAIGDFVKTGQLIAKKNGFISANVHSSVSGKVVKIDDVINASGYKSKAIIISVTQDD